MFFPQICEADLLERHLSGYVSFVALLSHSEHWFAVQSVSVQEMERRTAGR